MKDFDLYGIVTYDEVLYGGMSFVIDEYGDLVFITLPASYCLCKRFVYFIGSIYFVVLFVVLVC